MIDRSTHLCGAATEDAAEDGAGSAAGGVHRGARASRGVAVAPVSLGLVVDGVALLGVVEEVTCAATADVVDGSRLNLTLLDHLLVELEDSLALVEHVASTAATSGDSSGDGLGEGDA